MNSNEENRKMDDAGKRREKGSTAKIPLVSLEEALNMVKVIHEKALESAPLKSVAKSFGFAGPSSTPFFRRLSAARLFGLISPGGAELTEQARDYLKPVTEDACQRVLSESVASISAYAELIQQHNKKKLNQDILAHWFERKYSLSEPIAKDCARAFIGSIRFAGFLSGDGTLLGSRVQTTPKGKESDESETGLTETHQESAFDETESSEKYSIILDAARKRRVTINSPPTVTSQELKRIQEWLAYQLIVIDEKLHAGTSNGRAEAT